jgi:hypothetical protein
MADTVEEKVENEETEYVVGSGYVRNLLAQAMGTLADSISWLAEASVSAAKEEGKLIEEAIDDFMACGEHVRDEIADLMGARMANEKEGAC